MNSESAGTIGREEDRASGRVGSSPFLGRHPRISAQIVADQSRIARGRQQTSNDQSEHNNGTAQPVAEVQFGDDPDPKARREANPKPSAGTGPTRKKTFGPQPRAQPRA